MLDDYSDNRDGNATYYRNNGYYQDIIHGNLLVMHYICFKMRCGLNLFNQNPVTCFDPKILKKVA